MRIARLDLHAFGPFTNARLAFDHKPRSLQLVYGPNEAGKSSTLRAVLALLYGIPARTSDAHLHEMGKLRIGGVLLDHAGLRHEVVRRKGLKHTLLNTQDKPLAEDALSGMLGGLDESMFRQMFGLDHERLRQGAEALLAGGGNLGEGLFDAGTGARTIRLALESLEREAEALFKPRGRTPKLNLAIDNLREHVRAQREAALSPQAFLEQERGLTEARTQRESAVQNRRRLWEEKTRLTRAITMLPLLSRHTALSLELAASHTEASETEESWEAEHRELLLRFQALRRLEAELPAERARAQLLTRETAALKARVLSAGELQQALDTPTRTRLRKLAESHDALLREQRELARAAMEHEAALLACEERLLPATTFEISAELRLLVEQTDRERLEQASVELELALSQAESALGTRARALGVSADADTLAALEVPEDQALLELDNLAAELEQERKARSVRERTAGERAAQLAQARELLLAQGALASPEELAAARAQREQLYQELRDLAPEGALRLPARAPEGALRPSANWAHYEISVRQADELADRLRREAQRAAEFSRLEAERRSSERELQVLATERSEQEQRAALLAIRVRELAQPLGLSDVARRELRARVLKLSALVEQASAQCARRAAQGVLLARLTELSAQLEVALGPTAGLAAAPVEAGGSAREPNTEPASSPAALLRRRLSAASALARGHIEARQKLHKEQEQLRARRDDARLARAAVESRVKAVAASVEDTRARFRAELVRLGLASDLSPDEALSSLEELAELERKSRELDALESRLAVTASELAALEQGVRSLATRVAPSGFEAHAELDAARLLDALEHTLHGRRERRREKAEKTRELAKVNEQLHHAGDGASLDELRLALKDLEPDRARARLLEIEEELERCDQDIEALGQTIGGKEAGLSLLEQPSQAVSLAEEVQSDVSSVRALIRRYLELRLSRTLLKREVERYRSLHQGPVLSRASELFPLLTVNRYRGLDVEYDERDEAVLCALRKDGKTVRVTGLSDGTRDQLYLALRVASIERFLENNPALPLVLDDAFIHFDDQRAEAALRVLGDLCQRTQVLLFTHHARMVELAKSALGREGVTLHELDSARGVINLRDDGPLFSGV